MKAKYTIKKQTNTYGNGVQEYTLGKDNTFYLALSAENVYKAVSVQEAVYAYNLKSIPEHIGQNTLVYVQGPKGAIYPILHKD